MSEKILDTLQPSVYLSVYQGSKSIYFFVFLTDILAKKIRLDVIFIASIKKKNEKINRKKTAREIKVNHKKEYKALNRKEEERCRERQKKRKHKMRCRRKAKKLAHVS